MPISIDDFDPALVTEGIEQDLLTSVEERVRQLHGGLTGSIEFATFSPVAKIPAKVRCYTYALAHRIADLSRAYVRETNARALAPSFLLARALLESACHAYDLANRVSALIKSDSTAGIPELDDHLTRLMHGAKAEAWRPDADSPEALNVLTTLKRVARELGAGLEKSFEDMSEFAHPNAAGVLSSYSDLFPERHRCVFHLEPARQSPGRVSWHLRAALLGLAVFMAAQTILNRAMDSFIALCEREVHEGGTWPPQVPYPRPTPRA